MKLIIPEPCSQKWNEMEPAFEGKFCSTCTKNVVDFTGFTDSQLAAYFKMRPNNVCGKLSVVQINRNLASPIPYARSQSTLLLGLGFSALSITGCVPELGKVTIGELEITEYQTTNLPTSSKNSRNAEDNHTVDTVIKGIVKDTFGLSIVGATVTIHGSPIGVITDYEGRFKLNVPVEQNADTIKLSIQHVGYIEQLLSVHTPFSNELNVSLVRVNAISFELVGFVGGICIKPTRWQRIKSWVTFWK
ncbi:MAG TPA: carboxypeptidase-like regulatory domain-containing protein [Flavitalea sp.]|nr:carboxypeptidase-like regulatory domain-containing protein [Flavitalea sp.]